MGVAIVAGNAKDYHATIQYYVTARSRKRILEGQITSKYEPEGYSFQWAELCKNRLLEVNRIDVLD